MGLLLMVSRAIDAVNLRIGKAFALLVLVAVLVSSGNAIVRKVFDLSSNAWLELQWILFSAVFLLCAPWTLLSNEHVRIDILNSLFPPRVRNAIDIIGHVLFLLPLTIIMVVTSIPFFLRSIRINEQSFNSGGLPQWPAKSLIMIGFDLGLFRADFLQALPGRVYGVMGNDTLLAIPFFTFMGLVLERSGMAEDLLDTVGQLFGTVRGGLAYAVIFVGALLAATTGVVAASVISMGLISLPIMLRYGYDRRVASGVIAASGTLAQIIPPSLVLIVMADQLGRSVGDMYEGAFIPGVVLACLYAVYIFIVTNLSATAAPGLPPDAVGFREPDGNRGLRSLTILAVASGVLGYFLMRDQPYRRADF